MKRLVLAAALAATSSFAVQASELLNYNYIEGGYARTNIDVDGVGDADFDGFQIRGSAELGESFYLFGGYGSTRNDDAGVDIDFDELQGGVGYRVPVGQMAADFLAEAAYLRQEIDADDIANASASGGRISVGFRGAMSEHFEGYAKASYNNGGDFDGSFSGLVGMQFKFAETWGIVGEIEAGELGDGVDVTKYLIGLRASF